MKTPTNLSETFRALAWAVVAAIAATAGPRLLAATTDGASIGPNSAPPAESASDLPANPAPDFALNTYAALGSALARNSRLGELGWSESEISAFLDGVRAAMHGHAYPYNQNTEELSEHLHHQIHQLDERQEREQLATPSGLAEFIKDVRKKARLRETDSGLCYRFMSNGTGVRPRPTDTVVVSYRCMLADNMTELPHLTADHLHAKVADLLPGLSEGLQMMTVGSRVIFLLPPTLSYGTGEWPDGVNRGMPLAFVVELHEVVSGS